MRKMLVLTTLLFGLLLAGCSEDSNNNGSQAGNGGSAGFEGNNPALAITVQYAGGLEVNFSATLFDQKLGENYSFLWDFGDNSSSDQNSQTTLANPKYKYAKEGKYNVKVSVTDSVGTPVGYNTALVTVSKSGLIKDANLEVAQSASSLLTYDFVTKATSTSGIQLTYTWDFKDGGSPEVGPNRMSHTFSKYGTEYTVEVKIDDKASGETATVRQNITTPIPGFDIECSVSGLVVTCTPQVTGVEGSLDNAVYTWKFSEQGGSSSVEETTRNNDPVVYTFNSPGQKNITVTGTSSQVTGTLTASSSVNLSNQISLGAIECRATGELLQYTCSVNGQVINNGEGELSYEWKFNNNVVPEYTGNEATYTFSTFPSASNPSYPVSVTATLGQSQETATQNARINIARPTVTIQKGSDNATASTMSFVALLDPYVDGASYTWTITGPSNFNHVVTGSNKTNTGEVIMQYEGTYTANLKVEHTTFGVINAAPLQAVMSASVEGATINCSKTNGMQYTCSTNARGYATVNGVKQEVPLNYTWNISRGDGKESYEITSGSSFTKQLLKYGANYTVNLVLTPQGTNKAVRAPAVSFTTDKPTLSLNKTAATVGVGGSITFTPVVNNKLNNIELSSPIYTWTLDGTVQGEKTPSYTRTFQSVGQHTIKVDITAENLNGTLTATTTIEALATAIKPEDINNVTVDCQHTDRNLNDIKKLCTVGISYRPGLTGVDTSTVRIHLIPRGVRGNADSPAVVFGGTAPQQQAVIFDWPFLNINELENKNQRKTFDAYLGIEVYANNKKIKTFNDVKYTIQYPIVSYELRHYANTANNRVGTGADIGLKSTAAPFNGQATWEWHMYYKGFGGTASKTFEMGVGDKVNFAAEMKKARFAGTVKGNPFNLQSGFGVKITGNNANVLSKPLYLYGVNTKQGVKDDQTNALGAFLDNSSWMSPQGTMYWEGQEYRDTNHHGYVLNFALYLDDREYVTDGWKQFCLIGSLGYGRDGHLWALPEAKVLSTHPTLKGRYSAVVGFAGSLQEKRSKTPQGGQPALPKGALSNELWWKVKGAWFELPDYGFRGAQVGYMTTLGNMETCKEVKTFKFEKTNSAVYNPWNGQ